MCCYVPVYTRRKQIGWHWLHFRWPGQCFQGRVALSTDGNTLASGGPNDDSNLGAVWIFTRSGTTWSQEGSNLIGTGSIGSVVYQGRAVALSSDGNTLASGGYGDNSYIGAVWIFTRSGTTWSQQGSKLVGTGAAAGNVYQGYSVALSSDGNTLASGGRLDDTNMGAVWIFTRSGTTWSQQGSKLVGTGAVGSNVYNGYSVALSSDGNTLASSGRGDDSNVGAVWIFTRSKLVGTGYIGNTNGDVDQGWDVALSSDGNTLASGGPIDDSVVGAVWIFIRSGSTWSQEGSKLVGTGAVGGDVRQGYSVALSSDGNTLASGGWKDDSNDGAVWIFIRSGSTWSQEGSKLVGSGASGAAGQGSEVSLSGDGSAMVSGGLFDDANVGAAWVFIDLSPTSQPSGQPSSLPSSEPSGQPSGVPSGQPSCIPSGEPSGQPSGEPSGQPSRVPSGEPSGQPSGVPSGQPSCVPSGEPSAVPSGKPSCRPSHAPTSQPTMPTGQPSGQPAAVTNSSKVDEFNRGVVAAIVVGGVAVFGVVGFAVYWTLGTVTTGVAPATEMVSITPGRVKG